MKKFTYKTNINCSGCVATVKPHLDAAVGINNWQVDTEHPDKLLTVHTLDKANAEKAVKEAGFTLEHKRRFGIF